jgi:simple sugar transport system permease protein
MNEFIASIVLAGVPLLYAALGGIVAERSGVLNVGLEGFMLFGAFFAAWAGAGLGGTLVAFVVAIAATFVLGCLLGWVMVALRGDQVVVGIAFNIAALGASSYFFSVITDGDVTRMSTDPTSPIRIPLLAGLPVVGSLFDQHWIVYLAVLLVPAAFYLLFRTGLGIRVRACGEFVEGARAAGVNVISTRILATGVSGALAGAGGAYLVLVAIHRFSENMTSGQGYIALAVIILGRWTPIGAGIAALVFALAQALSLRIQSGGAHVPVQVFLAIPYVITLVAVAVSGQRARPPAEEGRPLYVSR